MSFSDSPPVPARRVALALGSGGARGYAHIGAIQVIQESGFNIVNVAGSSMGALVGGLYVAGRLDDYGAWVRGLTQFDVLRLLDVSLSAPGAFRAEKILARVRDLVGGVCIEDLPIPFTAVATDLLARKAVWFQHGPLAVAIRASIAMPGVFTPVRLHGRLLVDGGVMEPVPIAPTASAHADATIAVDLGGERRGGEVAAPVREEAEERRIDEWIDWVRHGTSRLLDREALRSVVNRLPGMQGSEAVGDRAPRGDEFEALPAGLGMFDVMNQSLEAMQSVLTRYRLAGNPPDVLVTVPKDACRSLDFHRASEMIELGRALTLEALGRSGLTSGCVQEDSPGPAPTTAPDGRRANP